jgi:prepilin-type N-terminal cleavage/methylation domain-containing protein
MKKLAQTGFTLAELLVTVGLIGTIAAITLPGVLDGMATSNRRVVMKDTLKILTEAAESLTLQGNVPTDTYQAMVSRIRVLKKDDTNKIITLHNKATLASFNNYCGATGRAESIAIDLEGRGRADLTNNNVVWVVVSWEPNNTLSCDTDTTTPGLFTGGMVKPMVRSDTPNNLSNYRELTR